MSGWAHVATRGPSSRAWTSGMAAALSQYRAGEPQKAARCCHIVLEREPDDADALGLLGLLSLEAERFEEAAAYLARATCVRPDAALLHLRLGTSLLGLRRHAEAAVALRRASDLAPDNVVVWNNLGNALAGLDRLDEAIAGYQHALSLRPSYAPASYNLGRAYMRLDRIEVAADAFFAAVRDAEGDVAPARLGEIYDLLFGALLRLGRDDEARAVCAALRALGVTPGLADWNEALVLLKDGHFAEGWSKYEARYSVNGHDRPHAQARPLNLAEIAGRRILVCGEQGHGDVIQFVRYAPLLAERGAQVYLSVYRELQSLLRDMDGVTSVIDPDDSDPQFDLVTALPSLPLAFGTDLTSVPATVPYLRASAEALARWRSRLGPHDRPRIGVCWRGSEHQHLAQRSMPVARLAPLFTRTEIAFHALQKELPLDERQWLAAYPAVSVHGEALGDYAETAGLIECLDLVITIDTSAAHLAGALARPVWVILPFSADWRWLKGRVDSPWYPTARLFRQPRRGDWDSIVTAVAQALDGFGSG